MIPLELFFTESSFSQRMQKLYLEVKDTNVGLPDSLEIFAKQVLAKHSFQKKVKGGGKRTQWNKALTNGIREAKLENWKKNRRPRKKRRESRRPKVGGFC